jgi:hypothetical protein
MQNQLRAENAADKAQIDKLAAALKEAERVVSWGVCWLEQMLFTSQPPPAIKNLRGADTHGRSAATGLHPICRALLGWGE